MQEENFDGMPIAAAVRAFLDAKNWRDDTIEVNEDRNRSTVATSLLIDEQEHRLFIEGDETNQQLHVFFYTPYNCLRSRMDVMARILNRCNTALCFGRLAVDDGPTPRPIQFKVGITPQAGSISSDQIDHLVGLGVSTFRSYGELLICAAMTKRGLEDLWMEHLAAEEEPSEWTGVKVPRLLN